MWGGINRNGDIDEHLTYSELELPGNFTFAFF